MVHFRRATLLTSTAVAAVLISSCSSGSPPPPTAASSSRAIVQFTCCQVADISPIRHPGETFAVHWIRTTQPNPSGARVAPVALDVSLSFGYHDVSQLKAAESRGPREYVRAARVLTTDAASTAPVSKITIPRTAAAGLYNLSTTVTFGGGTAKGGSIIRVQAD